MFFIFLLHALKSPCIILIGVGKKTQMGWGSRLLGWFLPKYIPKDVYVCV